MGDLNSYGFLPVPYKTCASAAQFYTPNNMRNMYARARVYNTVYTL